MSKYKPILLLVLVFFAGIAVGVVGTRIVVRRLVSTAIQQPEQVRLMLERRLTRQLQLDAPQREKLHQILLDTHGKIKDIRQEFRPRVVTVRSQANDDINQILTPEQRERFEHWKKDNAFFMRDLRR